MRRLLQLIFSVVVSLAGYQAQGQLSLDSLETKSSEEVVIDDADSIPSIVDKKLRRDSIRFAKKEARRDTIDYPLLSAVSIYFDYPKLFAFFTEFENKAEIGVELQILRNFRVLTELGRGRIQPRNFYKNVDYEVSGNYYRVGIGYTKALGGKSRLNFGFNYGSSFFEDSGNIQIESPSGLFSSLEEPFRRESLRGDWFEITFGTESHMGKNIYAGFIARIRKLNSYDSFEDIDVFTIPGYGRTFDNSIPALNLYVKYRIPFY